MKRLDSRSHCPVNFALEIFGDSWSLLIVRDIAFWGKKTYGEFLSSDEHIATNILSSRLAHLEKQDIIAKQPHPSDGRKEIYLLTNKGLDLIPVLLEICGWSARYDNKTTAPQDLVAYIYANREAMYTLIRKTIQSGGSLFAGANSVVAQLAYKKQ